MKHMILYRMENGECNMNKWKKTGLAVTASAAVISTAHIINQMIFSSSVVKSFMIGG